MNILNYVKNVKEIKKSDLQTSIRTEIGLVRQVQEIRQLMLTHGVDIDDKFQWTVPGSIMNNIHKFANRQIKLSHVVDGTASTFVKVLEYLQSFVEKEKTSLWNSESLTIKQANALTLIEQISFWTKYTQLLLDGIISEKYDPKKSGLTSADFSFLNKTLSYYVDISSMAFGTSEEIIKKFNELMDGQAEESSLEILESVRGVSAVSPFDRGISIHHFTPIYWIENMMMNYDLYRLKKMKDDNLYFASKIAQIENRRNGENDPLIDSQINVYQERLIKNRATSDRIRAKYN